ncbi:epoxide hydrolase [Pyrenophora seminiperda CCB06]|uniref:Epoxide hydrolase n=1 Tax=Pyrenophora seminiperda CCB06 TaxID=1302712 RepID=A0A3M7M0F7_9PLEO|nr:epoxide hydrolase [Pyrenophora seminiperda CCB06]
MDGFERKTLKTSRGYTYTYYTSPGNNSLPTLLFLHGWPDHAAMWKDVAGPLRSLDHPIIIPDMLGYDGTDKPTDPSAYTWDLVTADLTDILDAEGRAHCISIGHDWGSAAASRLLNYHPDRVVGLVNINVAYEPPTREPFDLEDINQDTKLRLGYPCLEYWHLFTAPDGPAVLKAGLDRLFTVMHGDGDTMKNFFCTPNALRDYLTGKTNPDVPLRPYSQDAQFKSDFIDRMTRDGFEAPQCWYHATLQNLQLNCDAKILEERDVVNMPELFIVATRDVASTGFPRSLIGRDLVNVPALFIVASQDVASLPETIYWSTHKGLLPRLEQVAVIDADYWVTYEKPGEVIARLEGWLRKNFALAQ